LPLIFTIDIDAFAASITLSAIDYWRHFLFSLLIFRQLSFSFAVAGFHILIDISSLRHCYRFRLLPLRHYYFCLFSFRHYCLFSPLIRLRRRYLLSPFSHCHFISLLPLMLPISPLLSLPLFSLLSPFISFASFVDISLLSLHCCHYC